MKILCLSDYVDPLVYSPMIKENFSDTDLILCAGDLPLDYQDFVISMMNKPTYFIFGNHNLKSYHLYHKTGHSDSAAQNLPYGDTSNYHGGTYAGFKCFSEHTTPVTDPVTGKKTPLLIAGVSGTVKYNNGLNQYTESQMKFKLLLMIPHLILNKIRYGRYLDILLTHASPRHIHDHEDPCHIGFECFNWFIQKFQPTYLVHGHIHLYDMREERIGKYGNTTVVNAYAHCTVDFPPENNTDSSTN